MRTESTIWLGFIAWLACTAIGFGLWQENDSVPGALVESPSEQSTRGRARLAVYLHPRCPCSLASLEEFAGVLAELPADAEAEIVFVKPPGAPAGWERGDLWNRAKVLPHAYVRVDEEGREAEAVGATTSGIAIYADERGRVLFHGGITRSRGCRGESSGRRALIAQLHGRGEAASSAPVFGCPLFTTHDRCEKAGR